MNPKDDLTVSLHDHFIRLLEEHAKYQDAEMAAMDKALLLARAEAEKQYLALNNLRHEYGEERKHYVERAVYEAKHEAIRTELNTVHRALDDLKGQFTTWGSIIFALSVAAQLALHMFWK